MHNQTTAGATGLHHQHNNHNHRYNTRTTTPRSRSPIQQNYTRNFTSNAFANNQKAMDSQNPNPTPTYQQTHREHTPNPQEKSIPTSQGVLRHRAPMNHNQ